MMKQELIVPRMGESISEATIGEIFKESGALVKRDEEILELETDKVNQVIYAPAAGTLTLQIKRDDVVRVGDVIGMVETEGEVSAPAVAAKKVEAAPDAASKPSAPAKQEGKAVSRPAPAKPTESARATKADFIAELSTPRAPSLPESVSVPKPSTGPDGGRLDKGTESRRKMTKIRKVIAQRLVEAQHTTAMLTTFNEVDMTEVMALRAKYQESFQKQYGVKLGFMSFFVKACVSALQQFPDINSYIDGDEIVTRNFFDIGVAVGTERGVIVPVVRGADRLSFAQVEQSIASHAERAKTGKLSADDLQGGCFTVTNGGIYGSLLSTPILNPPQSGILGMHKIEKRAVVINDQIVIRPMMYLALSYDHRIVDGKEGVSFLVHVKNCLEDPSRLLLQI